MKRLRLLALVLPGLAMAAAMTGGDFDWRLPRGFPRPAVPAGNPMSVAKVQLGRFLFYDKRLSVNGEASCATCHRQELAFTDGRAHARGATGELHPRGSMSLVNVAYAPSLNWANPALQSLEEQALGPMLGETPLELGLKGREAGLLAMLRREPVYQRLFPAAFAEEQNVFSLSNVTRAIAAFERTIVSMNSPYDRYRWGGDSSAISEAAKRGEALFSSSERMGCFQCHGGWNFSGAVRFEGRDAAAQEGEPGAGFFNTGVAPNSSLNKGISEHTGSPADAGKYRAPSLRNIAVTAPYMHDGSLATLEEVLDHYAAGGRIDAPNKSRILRPFRMTDREKRDAIEFLKSLTDVEMLHDARWSDPWADAKQK